MIFLLVDYFPWPSYQLWLTTNPSPTKKVHSGNWTKQRWGKKPDGMGQSPGISRSCRVIFLSILSRSKINPFPDVQYELLQPVIHTSNGTLVPYPCWYTLTHTSLSERAISMLLLAPSRQPLGGDPIRRNLHSRKTIHRSRSAWSHWIRGT